MSAALNNVATVDTYPASAGASLSLTGAAKSSINVSNAAVFIEATFRDVDGTTTVGAEFFAAPGFYSFVRPINKLRFRSAVAGVPARVTAEMLLVQEAG